MLKKWQLGRVNGRHTYFSPLSNQGRSVVSAIMTLMRWLLFVIVLLTCRVEALDDREPIIQSRNLWQEKAAAAYLHSLENNLEQPYQADIAPLLDEQHTQSIERRSDVHAPSTSSRMLQQNYWRTNNNNNRNSGINSDGTTDGNQVEDSDERLDGVDMPPISSLNGHQAIGRAAAVACTYQRDLFLNCGAAAVQYDIRVDVHAV
eukprot:scaffold9991_cov139-Skeletonema_dohrnii-CCMP3373.AAC.3